MKHLDNRRVRPLGPGDQELCRPTTCLWHDRTVVNAPGRLTGAGLALNPGDRRIKASGSAAEPEATRLRAAETS